jgi:hypothetical protein
MELTLKILWKKTRAAGFGDLVKRRFHYWKLPIKERQPNWIATESKNKSED